MYLVCSSIVGGTEGSVGCLLLVFWQERAIIGYRQLSHCCLHAKSFGNFTEFTITQVRFLKVTFYRDDSFWSRHLQLEVCVVWHSHESCERWASQYGVIL